MKVLKKLPRSAKFVCLIGGYGLNRDIYRTHKSVIEVTPLVNIIHSYSLLEYRLNGRFRDLECIWDKYKTL